MRIKKLLLFTAPAAGKRKNFAGSFETRDEAIEAAGKLKDGSGLWWQVIETATGECVAQDPGWTTPVEKPARAPTRAREESRPAEGDRPSDANRDA